MAEDFSLDDPTLGLGSDQGQWNSGFDLPGGGDTGLDTQGPSSFTVGPGQIPSDVYQYLLGQGGLQPGMSTFMPIGGAGGGGGGGGTLAKILQGLGLNSPLGLMQLLGPLASGLLTRSAINNATNQMTGAVNNANQALQGILGGAIKNFAPYQQLGQGATSKLGAYQFNPVTTQPAVGGQVMSPIGNWGPKSLAQIMRGY